MMYLFAFYMVLGFLLILAGIFDCKFLLAWFSYHNFLRELFGHKIFRYICIITGLIMVIGSLYEIVWTEGV